jgi:hypothetical protein
LQLFGIEIDQTIRRNKLTHRLMGILTGDRGGRCGSALP